jgi:putative transcriptional regulator
MSQRIRDLLAEHAMGLLSAADAAEVEAAVAADATLAAELAAWRETAAGLAGVVVDGKPPASLWDRIEADLGKPRPFAAFVERVAAALEVPRQLARTLLDGIDLATSWSVGPDASSNLYHIQPGARLAAAGTIAGFVRVRAGQRFPMHKHLGAEHVIVLQGGFRDQDGTDYHAGDDSRMPAGSSHDFHAHDGEDLIYLAVVAGGVEFETPFEL